MCECLHVYIILCVCARAHVWCVCVCVCVCVFVHIHNKFHSHEYKYTEHLYNIYNIYTTIYYVEYVEYLQDTIIPNVTHNDWSLTVGGSSTLLSLRRAVGIAVTVKRNIKSTMTATPMRRNMCQS